jgi:hypothetical protein
VRCVLRPVRRDYGEEMQYEDSDVTNLIATKMEIRLHQTPGCSRDETKSIRMGSTGHGFQLLSPGSVDPARPLMNGFPVTTMERNLELLSQWFHTCRDSHKEIFRAPSLPTTASLGGISTIHAIDVQSRTISELNLANTEYAALRYVWERSKEARANLTADPTSRLVASGVTPTILPSSVAKVVEDTLHVCAALSIPYLWVDLYCVDQHDTQRKAAGINAMGQIYCQAQISLIDGHDSASMPSAVRLLPEDKNTDLDGQQRIETIGDRQYITALPDMFYRLRRSKWKTRSWTYQEGSLARRVALFSSFDISFMCGAGTWRESLHSGNYGHDVKLPLVDLRSSGNLVLSANSWLREVYWNFRQYDATIMAYSGRELSLESDKLSAVSGCLNILAQNMGLRFICGLPTIDFHYALLWSYEQDRPRNGFSSWSWASWHSHQQFHSLYPRTGTSGSLIQGKREGLYEYHTPVSLEVALASIPNEAALSTPRIDHRPALA